MRYCVSIIHPPGFRHAGAFAEVAQTLVHGLRGLGCRAVVAENAVDPEGTTIMLGAFLLSSQQAQALPPSCIVYNFEQIVPGSPGLGPVATHLMARFEIWDYSRRNLTALRARLPGGRFRHVPLGYVPALTRIPAAPQQDIDVLFYGSLNARRQAVLRDMETAGLRVATGFGLYGAERDALIARSKLVLNMHYYESQIFEIVRVSYLLANRVAVVAECNPATEIDEDLREAVAGVPYARLTAECRRLLGDEAARASLAERGFRRMAARDECAILGEALNLPRSPAKRQDARHPLPGPKDSGLCP